MKNILIGKNGFVEKHVLWEKMDLQKKCIGWENAFVKKVY